MTPKPQLVATAVSTRVTEQQPILAKASDKTHSSDKGTQKEKDVVIPSNSDDHGVNVDSNNLTVEKKSDTNPHQTQLPNELITLIINHLAARKNTLYQCTLVSKHCHAIANPLLWKDLDLSCHTFTGFYCDNVKRFLHCVSDASPHQLATIGQHIRRLHLNSDHWTYAQFERLLPHLSLLQHVTIGRSTPINDTDFQHLARHWQHLTALHLDHARLSQASFSVIGQCFPRLCEFKWSNWDPPSPTWLEMLTPCPLESLHISFDNESLSQQTIAIIKKFHHLTILKIKRNRDDFDVWTFSHGMNLLLQATPTTTTTTPTSTTISSSSSSNHPSRQNDNKEAHHATPICWPQLTKLSLSPCKDVNDTTLMAFLQFRPYLQELELDQARTLSEAPLDAMASSPLSHLTRVTMTGAVHISRECIRRLIRQCRGLQYADFSMDDLGSNRPTGRGNFLRVWDQKEIAKIRRKAKE